MVVKYIRPPSWMTQQYGPSPPWINTWSPWTDSWPHDGSRLPYTCNPYEGGFSLHNGISDIAKRAWDSVGIWQESTSFGQTSSDPDDEEFDGLERIPWIPWLHLTMKDKLEVIHGKMLSDKHIYAAMILLKMQFPNVGSLQDPCLCQTTFHPADEEERIIQIHHTRGNHWVVSALIGGSLCVYDSLYSTESSDLDKQLEQIYATHEGPNGHGYNIPEVQKQTGSRDCGLFAIAFALELCSGNNPSERTFDQSKMRSHLIKCFETGHIEPFYSV